MELIKLIFRATKLQGHSSVLRAIVAILFSGISAGLLIYFIMPFFQVLAGSEPLEDGLTRNLINLIYGPANNREEVIFLGILSLLLVLVSNSLQIWKVWEINNYAWEQMHNISMKLLKRYSGWDYETYLQSTTSSLKTKVLSETERAVTQFYLPVIEIFSCSFTIFIIIGTMTYVSSGLALIICGLLGLVYVLTLRITRKIAVSQGNMRHTQNLQRFSAVDELLTGLKTLKLHKLEHKYQKRFSAASEKYFKSLVIINTLAISPSYVIQGSTLGSAIIIFLYYFSWGGNSGEAQVAAAFPLLGVLGVAAQRLVPELNRLLHNVTHFFSGVAALKLLLDEIEGFETPTSNTDADMENIGGQRFQFNSEIEFKNVCFRYRGAKNNSLEDINFTIKKGEAIGITGKSGSGKSTLINLLLGLLTPTEGVILVDGKKLSEDQIPKWQDIIAHVGQEVYLSDGTITSNIIFNEDDIVADKVRFSDAFEFANLDNLLTSEGKIVRDVGENGSLLSGGQKQRIALARAFYKNGQVLVLDEASSALDNANEKEIFEGMKKFMFGWTILMVAHRLTTLKNCQRLIILDEGKLSATGSWEYLAENSEVFKELLVEY